MKTTLALQAALFFLLASLTNMLLQGGGYTFPVFCRSAVTTVMYTVLMGFALKLVGRGQSHRD